MSGKVLLILCLGLFVASQAKSVDPELHGIVEEAETLLKELEERLNSDIKGALGMLTQGLSEIGSAAAEFEKDLNATLVATIGPFVKQIENTIAKAATAGVDAAQCTGDSIEEIEDLPAQLIRNVTSCIADKVNEANDVINGFIGDISNTTNVILDLGNQIRKCENGGIINLAFCMAGVTAKIGTQMISLPLKIAQDVAKAKVYILEVIPSFAACDFGAKAALILRAGSIVAEVTSCVQEKISEGGNSSSTVHSLIY